MIPDKNDINKFFEGIVNTLQQPLMVLDQEFKVLFVNRFFLETFKLENKDITGEYLHKIGKGEWNIPSLHKLLKEILLQKKGFDNFEIDWDFGGIDKRVLLLNAREIIYDNDGTKNILLAIEDITRAKHILDMVVVEKDKIDVMLRAIGDGVIATDVNGNVILMNKVAENLTGWTQYEATGKSVTEIFHIINENTREVCNNPVFQVLEKGIVVGLANHTILISKHGNEIIIADSGAPIRDINSKIVGAVLIFRDITYQQKIEMELQNVQKLELIGRLADGIAHDFNNYLAILLSEINYARMLLNSKDKIFDLLKSAEKTIFKATTLCRQLETLSNNSIPVKKSQPLIPLLKDTVNFILRGSNVQCEYFVQEELFDIEIDSGQTIQAIDNIIMNSVESMPDGGLIKVSAENVLIQDDNDLPLKAGNYVKLSIEDHGIGILKEHLPKIFEPYFTTKKKGSGLGLSIVFSIMKKQGGYVKAFSQIGKGATFCLYFPVSHIETVWKKNFDDKSVPVKGKVLIMDDEIDLLNLLRDILSYLGYDVEIAMNGNDAVELFKNAKNSGQPFNVVILDLLIPDGMDGHLVMKELKTIDPDIKGIISSGNSVNQIMMNYKEYGFIESISKPFTINGINKVLSSVLRG
jgi:two-component system, cell cycle sensor histidine kinase and response regulator CckA